MRRRFASPTSATAANTASIVAIGLAAWCLAVAGTASGGTIKGTIKLAGPPPEPKKLAVTIDQYICGKEKVAEDLVLSPEKGIRNAVVSIQPPPPGTRWGTPFPAVEMDQKQCTFAPRVVVVPVGGTVNFLNSDRLLHNLHSRSRANAPFNRTQPKGRAIPIVFNKPEIVTVDCDLHSWMRGWVVVADHPFFAVTDDQGEFTLPNVPPGSYTLEVWQESLGTMAQEVVVADQRVTTVTVEMRRRP